MVIEIPDNFLGKPIKGAMQKVLDDAPRPNRTKRVISPVVAPSPSNLVGADEYIILPSAQHGSYFYPDLLVPMERTHLNKNWNKTHEALRKDDSYMLTIRQFVDFLKLLKSGRAFDGIGKQIGKSKLESVLGDIVKVRNPYRAEWLDARFDNGNIFYHALDIATNTLKEVSEPLSDYLSTNKDPGISLNDWLRKANPHGLPVPKTSKGSLYYWAPMDGRVAWFDANSVGANLDCGVDPSDANASLGVRAVRAKN